MTVNSLLAKSLKIDKLESYTIRFFLASRMFLKIC
uniref:Uncharacterized protein n=1 Tax=Anguilla anguilla TaxID=7936 RepID=A0A0E9TD79_ANGAN